ncbi:MAG: tRNA pseudouridine(38-40) synthase TruA, partial [Pseudobdellovibrionaceae bacterium]
MVTTNKNIFLRIEYDGSDFAGWQRQAKLPTIQAVIEDILTEVHDHRVVVYGSGRTDSGVHAKGQIATFWSDFDLLPEKWASVLNFSLPKSVRVLESREVPKEFNPQKNIVAKVYEYRVLNRAQNSALDLRTFFMPRKIDWDRVREALPYFEGEKDFKASQGAKSSVKSTLRRVDKFDLVDEGEGFYRFRVVGGGFLKQMVRTMVGTALEVGEGRLEAKDIPAIFESRDRRKAGPTVPA